MFMVDPHARTKPWHHQGMKITCCFFTFYRPSVSNLRSLITVFSGYGFKKKWVYRSEEKKGVRFGVGWGIKILGGERHENQVVWSFFLSG
ncbi:MAG: hypothetical protein WCP87_01720, partial [Atribacterota bacterium]